MFLKKHWAKALKSPVSSEDTHFWFYPSPEDGEGTYRALVGVPHHHKPGPADVTVKVGGVVRSMPIRIADARYRSEKLKVSKRNTEPSEEDMARIRRDGAEVGKIYKNITRQKYWKGPFVLPVDSIVTSVYGTKRIFNGKMKSFHQGMDLRAKMGTPVHATAAGVVVLAEDLFFTGNTVMIDHGYGVITLYVDMSHLDVKKGDHVEARQQLGLSGMTGRGGWTPSASGVLSSTALR